MTYVCQNKETTAIIEPSFPGARKEHDMPASKGRHLVVSDRRMIEDMLRDGESVGAIATRIDVSWAA